MTRLPRLLDGSLSEVRRLHPVSLGIDQQLFALSTATMVLPPGETVSVRDWVELYTPVESAGIFRVVSADTDYSSGQLSVKLEHGICALGDAIVSEHATSQTQTTRSPTGTAVDTSRFTNLPNAEIGYTLSQSTALVDAEISGTASEVLSSLIGYQTIQTGGQNLWQVGQGDTGQQQVTVTVQYSNVLQMVNQVMDQLHGYYLDYDQSSLPWTMRVLQIPSGVTAEGRLSRNVNAARISYDTGDLCTKVYCEQATGGCAVSQRASVWGLVEHHLSIDSNASAAEADAACQRYLENREDPKISVTIDMRELSRITGDELDRISLAKLYRLALPDYAVSVDEMVVGVSWRDVFTAPDVCSVTLANHAADLVVSISRIAEEATVARTTAARATAVAEKAQAETEVSKYELVVTKEAVDTLGTRLRQAGIEIDENGVWIFAKDTTGTTGIGASLKVNADAITMEVSRATGAESGLSSRIGLTESNVSAAYGRIETVEGKVSTIEGSTLWANESSIVTVTGKMSVDNNGNLVVSEGTGLYATRNNVKYGIFDTGNLTAGVIVQKINGGTGETGDTTLSTEILGDKIKLTTGSGASTFTLSDKIIIDSDGYTKVNGLFMASGTGVNAKHVTINNGKITAGGGLDISAAQTLTFIGSGSQEYYEISANASPANRSIKNFVTGFGTVTVDSTTNKAKIPYDTVYSSYANQNSQVIEIPIPATAIASITLTPPASGSNTYTLSATKTDGTPVSIGTFSRAATLSGGWGSGSSAGIFSVDASPQDQHYKIKFNGTSGTADATLDAVVSASGVTPILSGTYLQFTLNIGTYTEGADMVTRAALTRSVPCSSVTGLAAANPLTVASQTDAQWADLSGVTEITSSITSGGKYLITATPKYGTTAQLKFIAPSGGGTQRTAVGLSDTITLPSSHTGTATVTDNIVLYDNDDETTNFPVTIDASAVYLAGQQASQAGNIDVVKDAWSSGVLTIRPASGTGNTASVTLGHSFRASSEVMMRLWEVSQNSTYPARTYIEDDGDRTGHESDVYLQIASDKSYAYITSNRLTPQYGVNILSRAEITGGSRSVSSLDQIVLDSGHTSSTPYTVTVHYDDGSTGTSTITVDASAISGGCGPSINVQTNRTQTYTANGTYTLSPSNGYDAMSSASITVNVQGGTTQQRTATGLSDTITLKATHTGTATISDNYVEYDDDSESANFPVRIDASRVYQAGVTYGQDHAGFTKATVTLISGPPVSVTPANTSSAFTLTGAGYKRLFFYSDNDGYVDAAADGKMHYWYYSNSHVTTGDYCKMGTPTNYYPLSSVTQDSDTYYTKDS